MIYAFLPGFQTPSFCVCEMKGDSSASLSDAAESFANFAYQRYLFIFYRRFWLLLFRNQSETNYILILSNQTVVI